VASRGGGSGGPGRGSGFGSQPATPLDADGQPVEPSSDPASAFSEMALYVLARCGRQWWLAAGQNTPIRPGGVPIPSPPDG
jgi:hypothetical protein